MKKFDGKFGDGASIVSGNSIVGEKENLAEDETDIYEPKMLVFNGLYYHGNWATPFQVNSFYSIIFFPFCIFVFILLIFF